MGSKKGREASGFHVGNELLQLGQKKETLIPQKREEASSIGGQCILAEGVKATEHSRNKSRACKDETKEREGGKQLQHWDGEEKKGEGPLAAQHCQKKDQSTTGGKTRS